MRYVIECIWSGYRASQARPCHRVVVSKAEAMRYKDVQGVRFTDGTTMYVSIRQAKPREQVEEIHGYDRLFSAIFSQKLGGWVNVNDVDL